MRNFAALFLVFSASALAYQITSPSGTKGWTNSGAQPLAWQRVDTDPLNFTAVLTNENTTTQQVLAALIDGTKLSTTVNPPSAGWPTGSNFRVNFVLDATSLNTILAQSDQFNITAATGSSTGLSAISQATGVTVTEPNPTATDASATATSSSNFSPPPSNAALPAVNPQTGLMGALALLGVFLA